MAGIMTPNRFDQAISGLSDRLRSVLADVSSSAKSSAGEIRLRVGKPVSITCSGICWFPDSSSKLHNIPYKGVIVAKEDIEQSIIRMCSYSVHSHQDEMKSGFISLIGGHRAGICGTAVIHGGAISAVREITSISIRVAREIPNAADRIIEKAFNDGICSLLIAGMPSSGKTTVLRDIARQLSSGKCGKYVKVAVVDERFELGAVYDGMPQNDLGPCCDVLSGYPKASGIQVAVRTLSPHVILCDEIGGEDEVSGMLEGINCGVKMIATAHASDLRELLGRKQIRRLLEYGVFERVAMLGKAENPGEILEIIETGDLLAEGFGFDSRNALFLDDGNVYGDKAYEAGIVY